MSSALIRPLSTTDAHVSRPMSSCDRSKSADPSLRCYSQMNNVPRSPSPASRTIMRVPPERCAIRIRLYRNGDHNFSGFDFPVSLNRYRDLEMLFRDLSTSTVLCDKKVLSRGVRYLFHMNGTPVDRFQDLQDGYNYVCSSTKTFRRIDYSAISFPTYRKLDPSRKPGSMSRAVSTTSISSGGKPDELSFIRPKIISVVRACGGHPRKSVRVLLNHKTAPSFEHVMNEISMSVKLDGGRVKNVYTLDGHKITHLQDFFGEDSIFLAFSTDAVNSKDCRLTADEMHRIGPQFVCSSTTGGSLNGVKAVSKSLTSLDQSTTNQDLTKLLVAKGNSSAPCLSRGQSKPKSGSYIPQINPAPIRRFSEQPTLSFRSPVIPPMQEKALKPLKLKYRFGKILGEGRFAVVRSCIEKARRLLMAFKVIDLRQCNDDQLSMIHQEVAILRQLKHPNIIQVVEEVNTRSTIYLIMELMCDGNLFDAIESNGKYSEQDASGILFNLASAIQYIHSQNIVHRDIKPENMMVREWPDGSKSLKLGDFGLATTFGEDLMYEVCGTPTYMAPEIISEIGYGLSVDLWSTGVVAYILLCGYPPFTGGNNAELFSKIEDGKFEYDCRDWDIISDSAKDLVTNLLQVDAHQRFTATDMLASHWILAEEFVEAADLYTLVVPRLSMFARSCRAGANLPKGVSVILSTALDKASNHFTNRRQRPSNNGDWIEEETFDDFYHH